MLQYSDFIIQHRNDDPRDLALHASRYPDTDIPYVIRQISAWQTAVKKLPLWAETTGIEYPVHLSMEQCSSQLTAEYKASILPPCIDSVTDLTAGFGVDATTIGRRAKHLTYVERDEELCRIAKNNLPLLGITDFDVVNTDGTAFLEKMEHQSLIFMDPARRDEHGAKTVMISDCTPNVIELQDTLLEKSDLVMIKLSPMLDITNITKELKCVKEIHVVSLYNECKEIVVLMAKGASIPVIHCININKGHTDTFIVENEREAECHYTSEIGTFLYEPNTSIMKASCFKSIANCCNVAMLHPNSHLYTSNTLVENFPGRTFKVEAIYGLKDKALKSIKKANITVRNFPASVAELRKRLKISEGGDIYLFVTTLADESKVVIRCSKQAQPTSRS